MIRTLFDAPGPVDWGQLRTELAAVAPIIDANDVGGDVAVYTAGDPAAGFAAVVAAHVPTPVTPTPDPLHQLALAIVEATTLDDIKVTAQAILDDGDTP
jgi:hypothetical protein